MYGEEGDELPDGVKLEKNRSIQGISRWKRYIIFLAGIFMNFVLAYVIFFVAVSCFPHYQTYSNVIDYDSSIAESENQSKLLVFDENNEEITDKSFLNIDNNLQENITENSFIFDMRSFSYAYQYSDSEKATVSISLYSCEEEDRFEINAYNFEDLGYYTLSLNTSNFSIRNIDMSSYFVFYKSVRADDSKISDIKIYDSTSGDYVEYSGELSSIYLPIVNESKSLDSLVVDASTNNYISKITTDFPYISISGERNGEKKTYKTYLKPYFNESNYLTSFNISFYPYTYWFGWSSFKEAGRLWVESTGAIASALGKLFVGQGWENVGGPVAILSTTTSSLINNPFYIYLYYWAMISVNLALFNLLPFPGLDGWQVLVEIIESIVNAVKKSKYNKNKKKSELEKENVITVTEGDSIESVNSDKEQVINVGEEKKEEEYRPYRIPPKVKTIVSYVGLGLLFLLALVIFVLDIIKLF